MYVGAGSSSAFALRPSLIFCASPFNQICWEPCSHSEAQYVGNHFQDYVVPWSRKPEFIFSLLWKSQISHNECKCFDLEHLIVPSFILSHFLKCSYICLYSYYQCGNYVSGTQASVFVIFLLCFIPQKMACNNQIICDCFVSLSLHKETPDRFM
jgi:hypothetical protein